jgi:hypothetical protein
MSRVGKEKESGTKTQLGNYSNSGDQRGALSCERRHGRHTVFGGVVGPSSTNHPHFRRQAQRQSLVLKKKQKLFISLYLQLH